MRETKNHSYSLVLVLLLLSVGCATSSSTETARTQPANDDKYAAYVWPPPPDKARIRLLDVLSQRSDVEAQGRMGKILTGASPQGPYDRLQRPSGVAIDREGRILVADWQLGAVIRFDRTNGVYDVFGTTGAAKLGRPLSVRVLDDGHILVVDAAKAAIVEFDGNGDYVATFGGPAVLRNPTDVAVGEDGQTLYVCDSKAHRIVVIDRKGGEVSSEIGGPGQQPGEFNAPTSVAIAADGALYVVDQLNARVQVFSREGEYLEALGRGRGRGHGQFVRPKYMAIDEAGRVFVSDAAFNNVQIFNKDSELLTFVGSGGRRPGEFQNATGVAAREDLFVIADQLGARIQLFGFVKD